MHLHRSLGVSGRRRAPPASIAAAVSPIMAAPIAVACRGGVYRNGHWRPSVAAGVGAAAIAAAAAGFYYNNYNDTYNSGQCGHYPYPPCY